MITIPPNDLLSELQDKLFMQRRTFLYSLGGMLSHTLISRYVGEGICSAQANVAIEPAIPIIMFHKVTEQPKYPEEIRSDQLRQLFTHIFTLGYRPVNMFDILSGKVDSVVAKGYKPLGITADDAHPSILFSRHTANLDYVQNDESFVEILAECAQSFHCDARATLFLSRQVDDRLFKTATDYFGGVRPLKFIIETLETTTPHIECAYHTRNHHRMLSYTASKVRCALEEQIQDFEELGVLQHIKRILAYPYGVPPLEEGIAILKEYNFLGALLAYPGVGEAKYSSIPLCTYDAKVLGNTFKVPRVSIGAYCYPPYVEGKQSAFISIDPIKHFQKNVIENTANAYISKGV